MRESDCIFALSTPYGKSGVALFRVSGGGLVLEAALPALFGKAAFTPRVATLTQVFAHNQADVQGDVPGDVHGDVIDQVLVTYFPAPHSFTGEGVLEISCHGSLAVLEALAARLTAVPGWRQAMAGEFSRRAFRNKKMDLAQAEGLADVLNARTSRQLKQAQSQAWGTLSAQVAQWRHKIVGLQALAEATIDFAEDLDEDVEAQIAAQCDVFSSELSEALSRGKASLQLRQGYVVALVGKPNAGKSSLLNALTSRDISIVTDVPGTTRDQVSAEVDIDGLPVRLVDTAGLRDTTDQVEKIGVDRAYDLAQSADLVIQVLAPGQAVDAKIDQDLVVYTHSDVIELVPSGANHLAVSSVNGAGLDALRGLIAGRLAESLPDPSQVAFVQSRQQVSVSVAIDELAKASTAPTLDLVGQHLRYATQALCEITGDVDVEDILDVVFGQFCIGK